MYTFWLVMWSECRWVKPDQNGESRCPFLSKSTQPASYNAWSGFAGVCSNMGILEPLLDPKTVPEPLLNLSGWLNSKKNRKQIKNILCLVFKKGLCYLIHNEIQQKQVLRPLITHWPWCTHFYINPIHITLLTFPPIPRHTQDPTIHLHISGQKDTVSTRGHNWIDSFTII